MSAAVVAPSGRAAFPDTPFKGLTPYGEDDAELFFGRDVWCEIVTDNLKAYRLTLFYGESGVGKSSLLQAGVAHRLRAHAPVLVFSSWRGDVEQGLVRELDALGIDGKANGHSEPTGATLESAIERCALRSGSRVYLILDQFEEYFVYHPLGSADDAFATALPRALARRDVSLSVLIAIREDAVARLDRFKSGVPNLFDNSLRLEHLDRTAAREAIERPLERWRATRPGVEPSAIEPELVEAVLDEVKAGTLEVAQGSSATAGAFEEVETPYLQLVLTRLWAEEAATGSDVMRLSTLQRLGGAQGIVSTHLASAMESLPSDDRDIAAAAFRYLVTRSHSKIAHSVTDLAEWTDVDQERLAGVMERLSRGDARILRPVGEGCYEIYHDVLADAVVAWRAGHEATRRSEEVLRRRIARLLLVAGIIAFAALAVLALLARRESNRAQDESMLARTEGARAMEQQAIASSREFAMRAATLGRNDYDLGLGIALAAWDEAETDEARRALTQILQRPPIRPPKPLDTGSELVWDARFNNDGTRILALGRRSAVLWDAARRRIRRLESGRGMPYAAFSGDGRRVVSGTKDTAPVVWDAKDGRLVATLPRASIGSRTATINATGTVVATLQPRGRVTVWSVAGGRAIEVRRLSRVNSLEFARHGATLSAIRSDGTAVVWRREGAPGRTVLPRVRDGSWTVSPDGQHAFAAGFRHGSRFVAITPGRPRVQTIVQFRTGTSASFTPDGRRLFTWHRTKATFSDARTGRVIQSLGLPGQIYGISPSRNGRKAVVMLISGSMRLWDTTSGTSREIRRSNRHSDRFIQSADLGPRGRRLVTTQYPGTPGVWDLGAEESAQLSADRGNLSAVAVSPRDDLIAIGTDTGAVSLSNMISGEQRATLHAGKGAVVVTRFARDGSVLLAGHADGTVVVWDVALRRRVATIHATSARLTDARLSDDGSQIVTADAAGTAAIWRVGDPRAARVLRAGRRRLLGAAFSPDGARVVTAERGTQARLWDARSGRPLAALPRQRRYRLFGFVPNPGVEFSPDGNRVLLLGTDGALRLWDDHGRLLKERRGGHGAIVNHATFSPDGDLIAAGTDDEAVLVLDGHTGELVKRLRAPDSEVTAVAFSRDSGQLVASAGNNGVTRVWDVRTAKRLARVSDRALFGFWWAGFAADGERIATVETDRSIRVRVCAGCLAAEELAALAKRSAKRQLTRAERKQYLHER